MALTTGRQFGDNFSSVVHCMFTCFCWHTFTPHQSWHAFLTATSGVHRTVLEAFPRFITCHRSAENACTNCNMWASHLHPSSKDTLTNSTKIILAKLLETWLSLIFWFILQDNASNTARDSNSWYVDHEKRHYSERQTCSNTRSLRQFQPT